MSATPRDKAFILYHVGKKALTFPAKLNDIDAQ